ncbi:hypothetical protein NM208_g2797 [Fusarium decemcellulare]|uniref:Uncharacterized protein n=1 Tax=Fusarium decemcellulare TaxID=57161 RepID=A0ACC1SRG7_9HYPO|nr:hypothetical protein NM208_g2797 [Fusarium decemcellulare]
MDPQENQLRWTPEDEQAVQTRWAQSIEKKFLATIGPDRIQLAVLWEVCLRTFKCSPVDLISPLRNLRYEYEKKPDFEAEPPEELFVLSENFSRWLTPLILHPIWKGQDWRLAMALQYASICHHDDRRPWKVPALCNALANLKQSIDETNGAEMPKPIHEMHREAREKALKDGKDPCLTSDLLAHLGDIAIKNDSDVYEIRSLITSGDAASDKFETYRITIIDLYSLTKAINTLGSVDLPLLQPIKHPDKFTLAVVCHKDQPSQECVREFHERAGLQNLRRLRLVRKMRDISGDEMSGLDFKGPVSFKICDDHVDDDATPSPVTFVSDDCE